MHSFEQVKGYRNQCDFKRRDRQKVIHNHVCCMKWCKSISAGKKELKWGVGGGGGGGGGRGMFQ